MEFKGVCICKERFSADIPTDLSLQWKLILLAAQFASVIGNDLHIQNDYLSNSKIFQDGNGNGNGNSNGNYVKINSNDFQDGNWEAMEMQR